MNFSNKVVIVTGAGSGIGKAIAIRFAKLSANLTLVSTNLERLNKVAEECKHFNKAKILTLAYDLRNNENINSVVNYTIIEFGKIDVLVNCAGIVGNQYIISEDLLEVLDDVLNVNLKSVIALTHYAANALIESKGCVINISSIVATTPVKGLLPYSVSKAALLHFTKCAALELAEKGVRVISISPGSIKTNIMSNHFQNPEDYDVFWESLRVNKPLKYLPEPEEIAELTAYLASEKAKSITGTDFIVDSASIYKVAVEMRKQRLGEASTLRHIDDHSDNLPIVVVLVVVHDSTEIFIEKKYLVNHYKSNLYKSKFLYSSQYSKRSTD